MQDNDIITCFEQRDEAAILESKQKYGHRCLAIAIRILGNSEDAEECVQDAWMQVWNSIPPGKPTYLFAYFARITRNFAINLRHKQQTNKRRVNYGTVTYDELAECLPGGICPEDELDSKATASAISRFLRTLPDRDRNLFIRRYFYAQSVQELAARYGMNANHISVVLHRTREKLAKYLTKEGIVDEKEFFHAISEIDPDLIDACERETTRRSHFKRPIAIAACLLFAITGILLIRVPHTAHPANTSSRNDISASSSPISSRPESSSPNSELVWNSVVQHVDELQDIIYFFEEDGVEMSNDEVLSYFHLNLPVSETLPELTPYHPNSTWARQRYFIFNSDGEAVYDQRVFGFRNSDQTKRILVNVSYWKAPVFFPDPNRTTACRQSNINGIGVTLFHDAFYTAAPYNLPAVKNIDADRYETALFVSIQLDDLTLTISGDGVSEDEFVRVIEAILKANPSHTTSMVAADTVQTKTGYVEFASYQEMPDIWFFILRVDEEYLVDGKYSNLIWECTPEEWQASGLQVGDRISFSYRGNPFNTIAIWKEQQVELKKIKS